jgi:hypothetical protein
MNIIKNVTEGIEPLPYQQALWDKLSQGGFKQGQMTLYSAGRQSGKSYLNAYLNTWFQNNLCQEIVLPEQEYIQELKISFGNLATNRSKQKKKVKKYQFSRAEWYVADFAWAHQGKVLAWCSQQFGPHPQRPDAWSRWSHKYQGKIHFRDSKDYEWFVLRWS